MGWIFKAGYHDARRKVLDIDITYQSLPGMGA